MASSWSVHEQYLAWYPGHTLSDRKPPPPILLSSTVPVSLSGTSLPGLAVFLDNKNTGVKTVRVSTHIELTDWMS